MDKKQAQRQIEEVFTRPFDHERYTAFLRNLLNKFEPRTGHYIGNYVPDAYKGHVNQYWRIGKYVDPDGEEMDLLAVEVKTMSKLERARSALRNFAINRLKQFEKDASLIAFYAKDDGGADWRFSFVKIEHEAFKDDAGKVKLKQELTPAKRYSYLVGEHEDSHIACKQLLPVLAMDFAEPRIDDIETAFSIEKVTNEFFEQYKALFLKLAEHLKQQPWFQRPEIADREQLVSRFAKKLLGQIVFLYFLQKKRWLGAPKGRPWGEGPKRFLRDRFDKVAEEGGDYYQDFLQYLFYEALAADRKDQPDPGYYERFKCRLPFLNGGLFEADYKWRKETIAIPNTLFHNDEKTKGGDTGTGILDVFSRYNFTIKEDEPLDKEVAVDPEMLGKVFENMLEVTERKSKGAFYTPREIVHYMWQESLIHYLGTEVGPDTETAVPREDLELLIRKGHLVLENDQRVLNTGKETDTYTHGIPETIRTHAALIDEKLADIRVCDPAIGSGAFPVGMLHEIVNAREVLAVHLEKVARPYDLKKHAIANSIYGVDIDSSAIDIARLRLWLSLIVDEDDYSSIDALPNLDYKIMQGNSLIEEYEGVKLFDEAFIGEDEDSSLAGEEKRLTDRRSAIQREYMQGLQDGELFDVRRGELDKELEEVNAVLKKIETAEKKAAKQKIDQAEGLFDLISEARKKAKLLEQRQDEFFDASTAERKGSLRDEITRLEWELIEATLQEQGKTDALAKLATFKTSGEKPYFLWKLNFSEVFRQKGGFDVVIGNPPYGASFQKSKKNDLTRKFPQASRIPDSYCFFFLLGISLLARDKTLAYITPNTYFDLENGEDFRVHLLKNTAILNIWESGWAFDSAVVDTAVTILTRTAPAPDHRITVLTKLGYSRLSQGDFLASSLTKIDFRGDGKTREIRDKIIARTTQLSASMDVKAGVKIYEKGKGNPPQSSETTGSKPFTRKGVQPDGWRALFRGSHIAPFLLEPSGEWIDYGPWLAAPRSETLFDPPKIVMRRTDDRLRSNIDFSNAVCVNSCHVIKFKKNPAENDRSKYLVILAVLNSSVCQWFFEVENPQMIGKTFAEIKVVYVDRLRLPDCRKNQRKSLSNAVEFLLLLKKRTNELGSHTLQSAYFEQLIDGLVYELYFPEEIQAAGKEILVHLGEITPIDDTMSTEEKLAIIQREFDRLYDPRHPVRNHLETLDSVPVVRTIREALKR